MFGTIISASDRGFWFAEADSTHQSVFIHQRHVKGRRFLHIGDRIKFNLAPSLIRPGEMEAVDVEWTGIEVTRPSNSLRTTGVQS